MKKHLLLLLLAIFATALPSIAESSYTITFKSGTGNSDSSTALSATPSITDVISDGGDYLSSLSNSSKCYLGKSNYGLKLGASGSEGSITLNLKDKVNATKIVVNAANYSSTAKNNSSIGVNGGAKVSFVAGNTDFKNIEFEINSEIEAVTLSSSKYCYVKSITVFYEDGGSSKETPEFQFENAEIRVPTGGTFESQQLTKSEGINDSEIVWTVTGNASVDNGIVTINDMSVAGEYTVTASFAGNDTYKSATASYKIIVYKVTPPTAITFTPNGGNIETQTPISLSVEPNNVSPTPTLSYSMDNGSTWTPYTEPFTLAAGTYSLKAKATALKGEYEDFITSEAVTFTVTAPLPVISDKLNVDNLKISTSYTSNASYTSSTTQAEYFAQAYKNAGFQMRTTDNNGSTSYTTGITVTKAPDGKQVKNIEIEFKYENKNSVKVYASDDPISLNSSYDFPGAELIGTYNNNTTVTIDKPYFIIVPNNKDVTYVKEVTVNWVDAPAQPKIVFDPKSGATISHHDNVTITATLGDENGSITYSVSKYNDETEQQDVLVENAVYTEPFTMPENGEGQYTVTATATFTDGASKTSEATYQVEDKIAPTSITFNPDGSNIDTTTKIELAPDADAYPVPTLSYQVDGGQWIDYSAPFTLPDGTHTVTAKAVNSEGEYITAEPKEYNVAQILNVDVLVSTEGFSGMGYDVEKHKTWTANKPATATQDNSGASYTAAAISNSGFGMRRWTSGDENNHTGITVTSAPTGKRVREVIITVADGKIGSGYQVYASDFPIAINNTFSYPDAVKVAEIKVAGVETVKIGKPYFIIVPAGNSAVYVQRPTVKWEEGPVITFNPADGEIMKTTGISIEANLGDQAPTTLKYKIDNGSDTDYTEPFEIEQDGAHTVTATATFGDGSTSRARTTYTVLPVSRPESITITPNGGDIDSATKITLTADENAFPTPNLWYKIDDEDYVEYNGGFEIEDEGSHTVTAKATAPNSEYEDFVTEPVNFNVTKAAEPYNFTVTGLSGDKAAVTFTQGGVESTDLNGLTFTAVSSGNNPAFNANAKDLRIYANGSLTISVPEGITVSEIVFNLSTQGKGRLPYITASVGEIATQNATDETVTWTGDVTNGEIKLTWGSRNIKDTDGAQFCFATGTITALRQDVAKVTFTPASGRITSSDEITISAVKGNKQVNSIVYKVNDGEETAYTGPFTLADEGEYTITATATFSDNTTAEATATYKVENVKAPESITITPNGGSIDNATKIDTETLISLSVADDVHPQPVLSYSLDNGKNWIEYKEPFKLEAGVHTLIAKATASKGQYEFIADPVNFDVTQILNVDVLVATDKFTYMTYTTPISWTANGTGNVDNSGAKYRAQARSQSGFAMRQYDATDKIWRTTGVTVETAPKGKIVNSIDLNLTVAGSGAKVYVSDTPIAINNSFEYENATLAATVKELGTTRVAIDKPYFIVVPAGNSPVTVQQIKVKWAAAPMTAPEPIEFSVTDDEVAYNTEVTVSSYGATTIDYEIDYIDEGIDSEIGSVDGDSWTFNVTRDCIITVTATNAMGTTNDDITYEIIRPTVTFSHKAGIVKRGTEITITPSEYATLDCDVEWRIAVDDSTEDQIQTDDIKSAEPLTFKIEKPAKFTVMAVLPNGYESEVVEVEYTLAVPAKPVYTVDGENVIEDENGNVLVPYNTEVTVSADNAESLTYFINYNDEGIEDKEGSVDSDNWTFKVEYDCEVLVTAHNAEGDGETAVEKFTIKLPEIVFDPASESYVRRGQVITFRAEDAIRYVYTVQNLNDDNYEENVEVNGEYGTYKVVGTTELLAIDVTAYLPNNYSTTGSAIYTYVKPTEAPNAPTFSIADGASVEIGTELEITPEYPDETVYVAQYSITGHLSKFEEYTGPIEIDEFHRKFCAKSINDIGESKTDDIFVNVVVPGDNYYQLVTDVTELSDGDRILIVNTANGKTMKNTVQNDYRPQTDVTIVNNEIKKLGDDVLVLELGKDGDSWTFKTTNYAGTNGYFEPNTGSNNHLYVRTNPSNHKATIAINGETGNAEIKFTGVTRGTLQYNNNNNSLRFSCYQTKQEVVQIYKETRDLVPVVYPMTFKHTPVVLTRKPGMFRAESSEVEIEPEVETQADGSTTYTVKAENVSGELNLNLAGQDLKADKTTTPVYDSTTSAGGLVTSFHDHQNAENPAEDDCTDEHDSYVYVKNNDTVDLVTGDHENAVAISTNPNVYHGFTEHHNNATLAVNLKPFEAATLSFSGQDIPTSVGNISVDNSGEVEYYTLQGVRVDGNTLVPGVYIRVQGKTATKVTVR